MGMLQEFKEFALKGNAVDMAVAVVVGAAFGKVVASLVDDLLMPPLGMLMGGRDFTNLFVTLDGSAFDSLEAAKEAGVAIVAYGSFIQTSISFFFVVSAVFLMVKTMNKVRSAMAAEQQAVADEAPAPEPTEDVLLLREIRDSVAASVGKLEETHAVIAETHTVIAETHTVIEAAAAKVPEPAPEPVPEPEQPSEAEPSDDELADGQSADTESDAEASADKPAADEKSEEPKPE